MDGQPKVLGSVSHWPAPPTAAWLSRQSTSMSLADLLGLDRVCRVGDEHSRLQRSRPLRPERPYHHPQNTARDARHVSACDHEPAMRSGDVGAQALVKAGSGAHVGHCQRQPVGGGHQPCAANQRIVEQHGVPLATVGHCRQ